MKRFLPIALLVCIPLALVYLGAWLMQEVEFDSVTSPDGRFTATVTHRLAPHRRPVVWRVRIVEHGTGIVFEDDLRSAPIGESLPTGAFVTEWRPRGAFCVRNADGKSRHYFVELGDWPESNCFIEDFFYDVRMEKTAIGNRLGDDSPLVISVFSGAHFDDVDSESVKKTLLAMRRELADIKQSKSETTP